MLDLFEFYDETFGIINKNKNIAQEHCKIKEWNLIQERRADN